MTLCGLGGCGPYSEPHFVTPCDHKHDEKRKSALLLCARLSCWPAGTSKNADYCKPHSALHVHLHL